MNETRSQQLIMSALNTDDCQEHWDEIGRHLEHALDFSPDITIEDVRRAVMQGTYHVIAVFKDNKMAGAVVYKLESQKNNLTAFVLAIGGRWICYEDSIAQFKDLLRSFGVTRLQGIARPSVARMWSKLGVTPLYTVMETVL